MELTLIFPHQLFASHPGITRGRPVVLLEDPLFFGGDRHWPLRFHAQKLVLHRASMKGWQTARTAEGWTVDYQDCPAGVVDAVDWWDTVIPTGATQLHVCDPVDDVLGRRLRRFAASRGLKLVMHETPMFLSPVAFLEQQITHKKRPFMAHFYQAQRKRMGILMDAGGQPTGGKWSFDAENRQRLPKGHRAPELPDFGNRPLLDEAKRYVAEKWPEARGSAEWFRWPVTREESLRELEHFLSERFVHFGQYEDAISASQPWLYHSVLTPVLNIGLITPQEIVDRTLDYAVSHNIPLNSLEGFIRQIIGWREFMRGIYHFRGVQIRNGNHWQHHEPLPAGFNDGTSGIGPVDAVVRRLERYAWSHHIERLMVMGNLMVLLRIEPHAAYRWFMEWYIDAYDWVMVPNVYGMSLHADGGTFTTKPYISGSNYILKMSDFPKGLWCGKWDDLFWSFLADHRDFFAKNPRMSVLLKQLDKRAEKLL